MFFRKEMKEGIYEKYFPKKYINSLTDVDHNFFKENNIKCVILDIDNTVINMKKHLIPGFKEWVQSIKDAGIEIKILSNTIDYMKVRQIAKLIDVQFFVFGRKPNKRGFLKIRDIVDVKNEEIAVIGDQIFKDIYGANKLGMYSILVNPIQELDDYFIIKKDRKKEEVILQAYIDMLKEGENKKEYEDAVEVFRKREINRIKVIDNTPKLKDVIKKEKEEKEKEKEKEKE